MAKTYIALVVNPYSERYGQCGKVLNENWQKEGEIAVEFPDNSRLSAGLPQKRQIPKILVWPEEDNHLLPDLHQTALASRAKLYRLHELNADETIPVRIRVAVREEFYFIFYKFDDYRCSKMMGQLKGHCD